MEGKKFRKQLFKNFNSFSDNSENLCNKIINLTNYTIIINHLGLNENSHAMTSKRNRCASNFPLFACDCFFDHRQLLPHLSPYIIHSTIRRDRPNATGTAIIIFEDWLNIRHIPSKPILLFVRYVSQMVHEPTGLQRIANGHENGELWVIDHAFKRKLNIVADDHGYA